MSGVITSPILLPLHVGTTALRRSVPVRTETTLVRRRPVRPADCLHRLRLRAVAGLPVLRAGGQIVALRLLASPALPVLVLGGRLLQLAHAANISFQVRPIAD